MKLLNFNYLHVFFMFCLMGCNAPDCTNNVQDGNETGIDCGGDCPPCSQNNGYTSCQFTYQGVLSSPSPIDSLVYFEYLNKNNNTRQVYLLSGQDSWDSTITKSYPTGAIYHLTLFYDEQKYTDFVTNGGNWSFTSTVSIKDGVTVIEQDSQNHTVSLSSSFGSSPLVQYLCYP